MTETKRVVSLDIENLSLVLECVLDSSESFEDTPGWNAWDAAMSLVREVKQQLPTEDHAVINGCNQSFLRQLSLLNADVRTFSTS